MKRLVLGVLCVALAAAPLAAAQETRHENAVAAPGPESSLVNLNLRKIAFDAAKAAAPGQTPQPQQPPAAPSRAGTSGATKVVYAISLGAAAGGTIYNIRKTREALDRKLEARTFPLVWLKTSDPADKGKMSAVIGGVNGALMAVSALAFRARNTRTAILMNVLVAGATIGVALHDRSVINKDKQTCPVVSACR
jgi:hypothetical protein